MTCAAIGVLLRVSYEVTRALPADAQIVKPEALLREARA
jgi:hypothetical protein